MGQLRGDLWTNAWNRYNAYVKLGDRMLTKEERQAVARRVFEALCTRYPDRHIVLFGQPGCAEPTIPDTSSVRIADSGGGCGFVSRAPD